MMEVWVSQQEKNCFDAGCDSSLNPVCIINIHVYAIIDIIRVGCVGWLPLHDGDARVEFIQNHRSEGVWFACSQCSIELHFVDVLCMFCAQGLILKEDFGDSFQYFLKNFTVSGAKVCTKGEATREEQALWDDEGKGSDDVRMQFYLLECWVDIFHRDYQILVRVGDAKVYILL